MNQGFHGSTSARVEEFLSGAYRRIRRTTIVLGLIGTLVAALLFGRRSGLALAIGSLVGYVNFIWLHHASTLMTERMIASARKPPSKLRLLLAFGGRYAFVVAIAYVIFKSQSQMLAGFAVALFFPIVAAMCEGIYEIFAKGSKDPSAE